MATYDGMTFEQRMVRKGESFEAWDLLPTLDGSQYFRVITPPDHSIFLTARLISGDAGPIFYSIYPEAVLNTVGTSMNVRNRRQSGRSSQVQLNRCTITGAAGFEDIQLIVRGQTGGEGIRRSGSSGPSPLAIYLPSTTVIVGLRTIAAVANVELRYEWYETDPLEPIND